MGKGNKEHAEFKTQNVVEMSAESRYAWHGKYLVQQQVPENQTGAVAGMYTSVFHCQNTMVTINQNQGKTF